MSRLSDFAGLHVCFRRTNSSLLHLPLLWENLVSLISSWWKQSCIRFCTKTSLFYYGVVFWLWRISLGAPVFIKFPRDFHITHQVPDCPRNFRKSVNESKLAPSSCSPILITLITPPDLRRDSKRPDASAPVLNPAARQSPGGFPCGSRRNQLFQ